MTLHYPIVLEAEASGAVSAYVPGLPVYAAADSHANAERAIRSVRTEYLNAHPASRPDVRVRVARVSDRGKASVTVVGDEPAKGEVTVVAHGTCADAETDCATICEECYKIIPKHVSVQRCDEGMFSYVAECLCSLKGN